MRIQTHAGLTPEPSSFQAPTLSPVAPDPPNVRAKGLEPLGLPLPPPPYTSKEMEAQRKMTCPRSFSKRVAKPGPEADLPTSRPDSALGLLAALRLLPLCLGGTARRGWKVALWREGALLTGQEWRGRGGGGGSRGGEGWDWNLAYWQWGRGRERCLSVRGRKHPRQPATPQQRQRQSEAAPWPCGGGEGVRGNAGTCVSLLASRSGDLEGEMHFGWWERGREAASPGCHSVLRCTQVLEGPNSESEHLTKPSADLGPA